MSQLLKSLESLTSQIEDPQRVQDGLEVAADHLRLLSRKLFESGGRSGAHGQWPRYTKAEAKWAKMKQKLIGGRSPMDWRKRSVLFPSLYEKSHPLHVENINGNKLTFGTRHEGAQKQQTGQARIPKNFRRKGMTVRAAHRRVIDLTPRQSSQLLEAVFEAMTADFKLPPGIEES